MFKTKKNLATALLMALPFAAFSQFSISGKIKEKKSGTAIPGSTIRIDDTFIASQSDPEGNFEIKNLKEGTYILQVSYVGFQNFTDTIVLTENKALEIELSENTILMDEVEV